MSSKILHRGGKFILPPTYVFMNTPPILASADAISVSGKADGVILVIASGKNEAKLINKAKVSLEQAGASLLGCILNNTTEE